MLVEAYINVMSEVSTVPKEQLQVEMSSEELGYIMVTYIMPPGEQPLLEKPVFGTC